MTFYDVYMFFSFCWIVIQFGEWIRKKIKKK